MNKNFIRFKRKILAVCLIKSVFIGASFGLTVAGALRLLSNYQLIPLPIDRAVPIGIAAFLVSAIIAFLLYHISDRKVARRLDSQFRLNEKLQTMLEYKNEEGSIYTLQREDAEASLASVAKKRVKLGLLWLYVLTAILGAAVMFASFKFVPVEEPPPVIPDEPFSVTQLQLEALEQLIVQVDGSEMELPHKDNAGASLKTLLEILKPGTTERERDEALATVMDELYRITDESSTAVELINALGACSSNQVKEFAMALIYYDWMSGNGWDEFYNEMGTMREGFVHAGAAIEDAAPARILSDTKSLFETAGSQISSALVGSGVPEADALRIMIARYATANESLEDGEHVYGFSTVASKADTLGYDGMQNELDGMLGKLNIELFKILEQHSTNTGTGEYAMTRIAALFDYPLPAFKRPDPIRTTNEDEGGGTEDDESSGNGGIGIGTVYGSDDLILDHNKDEFVEYGTLIDDYRKIMYGRLENGDYTEEEKEAIKKYFDILYGGFEDEE